jgi:hypothetical protein
MAIIDNGAGNRNYLTDTPNAYNGKISIELRGESSLYLFPKKSYSIETQDAMGNNLNISLLGMPPENDWVLYAPYSDKSLMRNVLAYDLGRRTGHYAPRTRYVELVLNGNYNGVYVLTEKIKVDNNRVDIAKLKPEDISGTELTGGYLLRVDKLDANDFPGWTATPFPQLQGENDVVFQYFDPSGEELMPQQMNYIRSYMQLFQSSLTSISFDSPTTGFKHYLDLSSTIDFMIVNEIGKNIDAYVFSTYLYKEKDKNGMEGKLFMGPLWDFNLAFGNVDYLANAQFAPGWMWSDQYRMFWYRRMIQDQYFSAMFTCRWYELRDSWLTNDFIAHTIDSIASELQEGRMRNFQRWPVIGTYVWPNQFVGQTYEEEIAFLKQWIVTRLNWMDNNVPGDCSLITAVTDKDGFGVYPNPAHGSVTIRVNGFSESQKKLIITNLMGEEIFNTEFTGNEYQWDGSFGSSQQLVPGVYLVTVSNTNGRRLITQMLIWR